jgi:signal transduction histidine kinase/HAMP domain-containing protein
MRKTLKSYLSQLRVNQKLFIILISTSLITASVVLFIFSSIYRYSVNSQHKPDYLQNLVIFAQQQRDLKSLSKKLPQTLGIDANSIQQNLISIFDEQGRLIAQHGAATKFDELRSIYSHYLSESPFTPGIEAIELQDGTHYTLFVAYRYRTSTLFSSTFLLMISALVLLAALIIRAIQIQSKKWLVEPILHLKAVTHQVSEHQNYSIRANKVYFDETGNLVDAFNTMLSQIQARDTLLTDARDKANTSQKAAEASSLEIKKTNLRLEEEARVRSAMERKLLEFQDFLNGIINSMPSILIALTPRYRITLWNRQAEKLTSIPAGQAINHRIDDAFPFMLFYLDLVHQANVTGKVQSVSQAEIQIAGKTHFFSIMIYPLNEQGLDDVVIKLDDITTEKHLQELVVQSEKMMSLGGLAAGMAHEINNPLGGILQNMQNLTRRLSPGLPKNQQVADKLGLSMSSIENYLQAREIPSLIDNITRAGHRAVDIVTNMLQFSRNADPNLELCDLNKLTKQALEIAQAETTFSELQNRDGLSISEKYDMSLPAIPCIHSEIEQVIINLLKNACQVLLEHGSPLGTPQINVQVHQKDNYAVIEITDNGIGMKDEIRKKVFEPFFTTKDVGKGTGLGLSVSYFIISSHHHGTIDVFSEPNKGTTFIVKLPFRSLRVHTPS